MPRVICLLALVVLQFVSLPDFAAEKPSARWMAHCAANLKGAGLAPAVVRKYCACMAGLGDEAEMLTWSQTELERSYPPAHRDCHRRARGLPSRPE